MDSLPSVCTVQAEYSFKGSNNDELCFKKGDIITVTQKEDGGWWEGTLVDKTGWFPSNYVKEYKVPLTLADTIRAPEEIQAFRSVVYNDLLDSERAHVAEVRGMVENFLEPLEASQILTTDEYAQLMCNFMEIVECHEDLYVNLEECTNDRVGKIFLAKAPIMKKVHQQYCALHPRAIVIVDKYKDELNTFMERQGAAKPGLLVLTTGLSKPFRRLDKYSAILQELERHMEICHPDRGDTQRSIAVYKDLAASCSATRRQKELELQILTGPVRGWQGQELSSLGEIIHMGSVAVGPDHRDRYFVLFPQTLLILSVSQRMSAFKYEGQLPISGITVTRLDDSDQMKNAFEISGPMIERIVAVCQGPSDANKWVDFLTNNGGTLTKTVDILQRQRSDFELRRNASTASAAVSIPQPPPHPPTKFSSSHSRRLRATTFPPKTYPPASPYAQLSHYFRKLVNDGVVTRRLMRALLYPQILQDIDTTDVIMRRRHKTILRMYRKDSSSTTSSSFGAEESEAESIEGHDEEGNDSSCCDDDSFSRSLERQDALDRRSEEDDDSDGAKSCKSSPFGYIKFYTGQPRRHSSPEATDYESFIDHGEEAGDSSDVFRKIKEVTDLTRDSNGSICFAIPGLCQDEERESMLFGSPTVKVPSLANVRQPTIHTTTARLNLKDIKQQQQQQQFQTAEASQMSSFEHRASGVHMACENLSNLDDALQVKNTLSPHRHLLDERHSMPVQFVGNRFNSSSVTEVYVHSWKDKRDPPSGSDTTHSSTVDIPAAGSHTVPDQMGIELMYNFESLIQLNDADDKQLTEVITPPSEFRNRMSLAREMSPFRRHHLDSDKKMQKVAVPPMQRCASFKFMQLDAVKESGHQQKQNPQPSHHHHRQQHHSPRSSDSGMAGSCTISSPDPPKHSSDFALSDYFHYNCHAAKDGNHTENKSDGGGGDAEPHLIRHSRSSHTIGGDFEFSAFLDRNKGDGDDGAMLRHDKDNYTDSGHVGGGSSLAMKDDDDCDDADCFRKPLSPTMLSRLRSHSEERFVGRYRTENTIQMNSKGRVVIPLDQPVNQQVFRTGLYAHWWKKEKLPSAVVKGLVVAVDDGKKKAATTIASARKHGRRHHGGATTEGMSPPVLGSSHPTRNTMSMQQVSQHKRSLSFNHHLSYNQVQQQQQVQARNQLLESHKLNRDPKSVLGPGAKSGPKKANWNITNLRPAPPLRPNLLTTTSASANTSAQQLQSSPASLASSKKPQPTYEEDALVLRVIEAYCAAYQNTSRNTIHSALQPWTPCLPIRGGKLKSSKPFSSSNPQLPFMCSSISSYLNINNNHAQPQTNSTSSLNSSHIWREASPNNFNLYGTSVSSLNTAYRSRYSIGGCVGSGNDRSGGGGCKEWRSASEEKPQSMVINNNNNNNNSNNVGMYQPAASKPGSNYDNIYMNVTTPLLGTRKNKQGKIWKISTISTRASPSHQYQPANRLVDETRSASPSPGPSSGPTRGSLYDRRLNRSFETSSQGQFSLGGCINKNSKTSPMRRSTPVLMRDGDDMQKEDVNGSNRIDSEDKTPTLRQIWLSVRQLQQDMVQVKTQISEERALRSHLQQLLISHLDASGNNKC